LYLKKREYIVFVFKIYFQPDHVNFDWPNCIQFHISQYKFTPILKSIVPSDRNFQVMPHIFLLNWSHLFFGTLFYWNKGVAALNTPCGFWLNLFISFA